MKVLIIGFGSIAKKHYKALFEIDNSVEVYALRSNEKSESIENVKSIYYKSEIFLFAPYDFVIISNPTFLHYDAISIAVKLKCPLFIEKPLFHNLDNINIISEINEMKLISYVACNLRFLESIKFIKHDLIPHISLNEVNIYCGSFLPEWRNNTYYKDCYSSYTDKGGGVHLDLIHEIDYAYWLFGEPKDVTSNFRNKSTLKTNSIDYANYLLDYDSYAVSLILNYYRRDYKRTIELVAMEDTFLVDLGSNSVYSYKKNKNIFQSNQSISDTYKKQLEYFLEVINSKHECNQNMNNINEAFEVLKICLNHA
jgi:predicted dehydrogenase